MLALSKCGCRIFRNNTGMAYQGKAKYVKGDIYLKNYRVLHAGLCEGSSDLIGWTTIEITKEMIGSKVAVFTAIEVKGKRNKASKEQKNFIKQVNDAGGISGISRSEKESTDLIENGKNRYNRATK